MVSAKSSFAIAPQPVDEVTLGTAEIEENLENSVKSIASRPLPVAFQDIRPELRYVALGVVESFQQAGMKALEQTLEMGKMLLRMKTDLKRREYQIFLKETGYSTAKANKLVLLAKTFDSFDLWQIARVAINTLFTLCGKTYASVVEKMRSMPTVTQETVEKLMKGARPPRRSAQKQDPATGWQQDPSGGGRHYAVNLYDEPTAMEIERRAEEQQVLPQRVIADAIAHSAKLDVAQKQFKLAVDEMRDRHIQIEKQLIDRDRRISDLESLLAHQAQPRQEQKHEPRPKIFLFSSTTWKDFAYMVGHNSSRLCAAVADWSASERAKLPPLLAAYLEENPNALDEVISWVPDQLARPAMHDLSFVVHSKTGCKFVSFEYLNKENEQWMFADKDNKLIPVLGRTGFAIEQF